MFNIATWIPLSLEIFLRLLPVREELRYEKSSRKENYGKKRKKMKTTKNLFDSESESARSASQSNFYNDAQLKQKSAARTAGVECWNDPEIVTLQRRRRLV